VAHVSRSEADRILTGAGWLPLLPDSLREEVLQACMLRHVVADEPIFLLGDPPGGIYGLVSGTLSVSIAPQGATPKLLLLGVPGRWTGEACFLTRAPRRGELRAVVDSTLLHLPLDRMDQIAARDPRLTQAVAQILMMSVEVLLRVIHDLQKPDPERRIASVLERTTWIGDVPIPITQSELATMANTSRRQALNALKRFSAAGWVTTSYRSITVTDLAALRAFAESGSK
jgi:CRP/FNR family transcriptional regulator, cyclic AMP receptor protein